MAGVGGETFIAGAPKLGMETEGQEIGAGEGSVLACIGSGCSVSWVGCQGPFTDNGLLPPSGRDAVAPCHGLAIKRIYKPKLRYSIYVH